MNEIRRPWANASEAAQERYGSQMLFRLSDVVARFPEYLAAWFAQAPRLGVVYDLYVSSLKDDDGNVAARFLRLMEALETLHRRQIGGKYIEDAAYQKEVWCVLTAAIPASIGCDLRDRLQQYLKYGNEFSLPRRLRDLLHGVSAHVGQSPCEPVRNASKFAKRVCDIRNYLTHYDSGSEGSTVTSLELHELVAGLRWLLQTQLMLTVGFTDDEISAVRGRFPH